MSDKAALAAGVAAAALSAPIPLDVPIVRGETSLDSLQLRRPQSGELRGLSLVRLGQMEVEEVRKLLPRITMPPLTAEEVDRMDPADLMECAVEVGDFFLSKRRRADSPTT